jgi:hypothetical protein
MSEVVTGGDTDALAAEYVIGTLDSDERAHAHALLSTDESFLAKVKLWERRLGELHLMVEPVEPDSRIWERIKGKMPEMQSGQEGEHPEAAAVEAGDQSTPALVPTESPVSGLEAPAGRAPEAAAEPLPDAIAVPGPEVEPGPAAVSEPASAASAAPGAGILAPGAAVAAPGAIPATLAEARHESAILSRRLSRWRAFAVLMILVIAAIAALLALWRFMPDSVPVPLRPIELIRRMGIEVPPSPSPPPARRMEPRGLQFEE